MEADSFAGLKALDGEVRRGIARLELGKGRSGDGGNGGKAGNEMTHGDPLDLH